MQYYNPLNTQQVSLNFYLCFDSQSRTLHCAMQPFKCCRRLNIKDTQYIKPLFELQIKYQERLICESLWIEAFGGNTYPNYALAVVIVFFYIPFVLVVILYSIILMKLKMQVHPGEQSANAEEQRNKRNKNVLKMAIAIVVVFFICFIPFFSNFLIVSLSAPDSCFSCSFVLYVIVTRYISYTNCAINPVICIIFSSNYRQAARLKLLKT